jgi:hypothetical protein
MFSEHVMSFRYDNLIIWVLIWYQKYETNKVVLEVLYNDNQIKQWHVVAMKNEILDW